MAENQDQVSEPDSDLDGSAEAEDSLNGITLEDALKELKKVRSEAARRRTSGKEKDAQLAEYEEWKKSQLTDLQRAQAEKAEIEAELNKLKKGKLQVALAKKHGLDEDFAELISGDSEEEMNDVAKRLAAKLGVKGSSKGAALFPGRQGKPVSTEGKEQDAKTAFNNFIRQYDR
jgi:hypothetical protein